MVTIPHDKALTQDYLKELFDYSDGNLVWKNRVGNKSYLNGQIAGTLKSSGYWQIRLNGKSELAHRLIYLFHHGYLPNRIDHVDGNPSNNAIDNLRECSTVENARNSKLASNNKTGIKGVFWCNTYKKWMARVWANGRFVVNRTFHDIELAEFVAQEAREKYHGEFVNHG